MPFSCVYKDCSSTETRNPELKFLTFVQPRTDFQRASKWIRLIGRSDFTVESIKYSTRICQNHFSSDVILNWRLNKTLEPYPYDVKNAIENEDFLPKSENRPASASKTYSTKKNVKPIPMRILHGVQMNKECDTSLIDLSGM